MSARMLTVLMLTLTCTTAGQFTVCTDREGRTCSTVGGKTLCCKTIGNTRTCTDGSTRTTISISDGKS
jgi:hypothetical protein